MKTDKKIIAVDFDNTLVFGRYPKYSGINTKLIRFIQEHRDDFIWILWTCRHGAELDEIVEWLGDNYHVTFDYVNENVPELVEKYGECRKVFAHYYIDDSMVPVNKIDLILEAQNGI